MFETACGKIVFHFRAVEWKLEGVLWRGSMEVDDG